MIGYRKLVAFSLGTLCNSYLAYKGVIDSTAYTGLGLALVGGFFAANTLSAKPRAAA